jgi:cytochrome c oxidase assembly protein subunit 15
MNMSASFDFAPVLHIMLMGLVLASGPLAWVWVRHRADSRSQRIRALTLLTLFLTFDLVVFGAFTRLTDSGLGCPDWPGCYGNASPVGARYHIETAQTAMPSGPVTHGKAWIEMIHRYLATLVGVLILVLAILGWTSRKSGDAAAGSSGSAWWPTLTLFWVALQGAFGALTVTMKLFPAIVTLHLLGGLVLLILLLLQVLRTSTNQSVAASELKVSGNAVLLKLTGGLLLVQIALGAWVSTNYAVLACSDFPMCQGSVWPEMNFAQGFTLWRELGMTADAQPIAFAALTAIHYVHRLIAYVMIVLLAVLAWRLHAVPALRKAARWLIRLIVLQGLSGLGNVLLGWPLLAALLHTAGAAGLVLVLIWTLFQVRQSDVVNIAASTAVSRSLA